jgi:ATP adenylyltransferase
MVASPSIRSRFSKYADPRTLLVEEPWDEVLYASESFVVVPTAGAVVEGWVLIVPKVYRLSYGELDRHLLSELAEVLSKTRAVVEGVYGSSMVFEHGPSEPDQPTGCTVDHAHLHVLPSVGNLEAGAVAYLPDLLFEPVDGVQGLAAFQERGIPYLYVDQGIPKAASYTTVPSQLLRRVVADAVGKDEEFDWRSHPHRAIAARTARDLRASFL